MYRKLFIYEENFNITYVKKCASIKMNINTNEFFEGTILL